MEKGIVKNSLKRQLNDFGTSTVKNNDECSNTEFENLTSSERIHLDGDLRCLA